MFRLCPFTMLIYWALPALAIYNPVRMYEGPTFFDKMTFYDNVDNTTWGNNTYLNAQAASTQGLAYVDRNTNRAIIRVDNVTNVPAAIGSSSLCASQLGALPFYSFVRITTVDTYDIGSLLIIDVVHLPYGCSVWPSFWTLGSGVWPNGGEIDVIETINLMTTNQMALHTNPGCFQTLPDGIQSQLGTTGERNCSTDRGCIVSETKPNPVGENFAKAGGGVWAVQMDCLGHLHLVLEYIPASIKNADMTTSLELTDWGLPSAAYPASGCNLTQFFTPQKLILNIALCGLWAGVPDIYQSTCHTPTNNCNDNIIGVGSPTYDQAYFEINYLRTYQVGNGTIVSPSSPVSTYVVPSTGSASAAGAASTDPFPNGSPLPVTPFTVGGGLLLLATISLFM
ncbi:concanavalin A-like lectin/glucanase domain-containing protein [Flagelloscypha sp. PMI_526]|nr:concanavalin A-like lectin/glucanase domain-containing protein [Flagelloscypha sp. PMI_526]